MPCSGFHTENGFTRVMNKLIENGFLIIKFLILKLSESPHANDVAIRSHHGNGFQNMLRFVAVHNHAPLGFEFPGTLIDIEHHGIHSEVHSCFLGTEPGSQA